MAVERGRGHEHRAMFHQPFRALLTGGAQLSTKCRGPREFRGVVQKQAYATLAAGLAQAIVINANHTASGDPRRIGAVYACGGHFHMTSRRDSGGGSRLRLAPPPRSHAHPRPTFEET